MKKKIKPRYFAVLADVLVSGVQVGRRITINNVHFSQKFSMNGDYNLLPTYVINSDGDVVITARLQKITR